MRNPAFFKGTHQHHRYFEGWYFKCISQDRRHAIALIPGMAVSPQGEKHAFIQVINAVSGKTWYFQFPYSGFASPTDRFAVEIGGNRFASEGLTVEIDQADQGQISGQLQFSDIHPYPVSRWHPGIMGPFSFIPRMECNHAIIHLSHRISGQLVLDGEVLDFDHGAGYIEKDYGRSFPETYVWIQASHFDQSEACLVFSRARIPMLGTEFPGFFAYLTDFAGIRARFATYNRSKLIDWQVDPEHGRCTGTLKGPAGTLVFEAQMSGGGRLRAPVNGLMDREIIESISATVTVRLTDRKGQVIYQGTSSEAGMEISLSP